MSYVYLLHFERPISPTRPAQHYLGWTEDLDRRLREHRHGCGSRLTQVARERGIPFKLAEVIQGDRILERQLKKRKNSRKFCPHCNKSIFFEDYRHA